MRYRFRRAILASIIALIAGGWLMAFPQTPIPITGQLYYDDQWNSIPTNDIRGLGTEDGDIGLSRGQPDEAPGIQAGGCQFSLKNLDGLYSPRNPVSDLYGKIGRNTPVRFLLDTPEFDITDTFSRSSTNSWGTPDTGPSYSHVWTGSQSINDFDVAGGEGTHVVQAASNYLLGWLDIDAVNGSALLGPINLPAIAGPTGGSLEPGNIAVRKTAIDTYYLFRINWTTANGITAQIINPNGESLINQTVFTSLTWTPAEDLMLRVEWDGGIFRMRVWQADSSEPATWISAEDYTYVGPGGVGVRSGAASGNSNVPVTFGYSAFTVTTEEAVYTGEVAQWPQKWDPTGTDVWTAIEAAGITRRLQQGKRALQSALTRWYSAMEQIAGDNVSGRLAWWPLEGNSLLAGIAGQTPMVISSSPTGPASREPLVILESAEVTGTKNLIDLSNGTRLDGTVPSHAAPAVGYAVEFVGQFEAGGVGALSYDALRVFFLPGSTSIVRINFELNSSQQPFLLIEDATGTDIQTDTTRTLYDNVMRHYRVEIYQDGADVSADLYIDGEFSVGASRATETLGSMWKTSLNYVGEADDKVGRYGQLAVVSLDTAGGHSAASGWDGETAAERISRLCNEESIPFMLHGSETDGVNLGPQTAMPLVDVLVEAATADGGVLYEPRHFVGYGFHTLASMYNKATELELDYSAAHLSDVPLPTEDDQQSRNLIVATRKGGGTFTHEVTEGPLSTQAPPAGIGVYEDPVLVNVQKDSDLPSFAGWRGHTQTWDEARWPNFAVSLHRSPFIADEDLFYAALHLDIAGIMSLDNVPSWLPPDLVYAQVRGLAMRLSNFEFDIGWTTIPNGPYTVSELDDSDNARFDTGGSVIAEDIASGTTAFDVATTRRKGPLWVTESSQFTPTFDVRAGGERMTVTDIAATQIPVAHATGTVDHDVNASVVPTIPSHQAGQLLICFAAIRNSGAGVPDTCIGSREWFRWPIFSADSNAQVFGTIAESNAETDPTVTFSGGVAGADTSAQIIRVGSGATAKWYDVEKALVAHASALNESGQDIPYPGLTIPCDDCFIIYFGWKQDDWTSVTQITGATEIGEPDTTGGNDHGLVWNRLVQTTKANIEAGVFTVTGGAAAISRGAIAAFRCDVQEFTVTRSVNGVVKAHDAGTSISLWTPGRFAK